jgi:hypothetical protein
MIEQHLSAIGRFGFTLGPTAPQEVREALALRGWVCVLPRQEITVPLDRTELVGRAVYSGWVRELDYQPDGRVDVGGVSLLALLGDGLGAGVRPTTTLVSGGSFQSAIDTNYQNGLSIQHVSGEFTLGVPTTWIWGTQGRYTLRELLDEFVGPMRGPWTSEWRSLPDGTIEFGETVGLTTPQVMCTDTKAGDDVGGLYGLHSRIGYKLDGTDYVTRVRVKAESLSAGSVQSASRSGPMDFVAGSNLDITYTIWDDTDVTTESEALAKAQVELAFARDRRELTVSCDMRPDLPRIVGIGDEVFVHAPRQLIIGDTIVTFHGQTIKPLQTRVYGMTYPITKDFTVVFAPDDWSTTVNLTQWLEPETGDATLEVGAPVRPSMALVSRARSGRF